MAIGERSEKRMVGPVTLGAGNQVLMTVPANRQYVLKQILIVNLNEMSTHFTLAIGNSTNDENRIFNYYGIGQFDTIVFDTAIVMEAGETLTGQSERGNLNVIVNGWEKQV